MTSEDRFKQAVIATLAKRAANRCSNPDCGAVTSGPSDDRSASVNVGEAAHIYGANPGSARYDESMASFDRRAITNAIWLCGNCHKLIDDDPARYPPGLLFEWQRDHEQRIGNVVGKAGAEVRRRYENRHIEEFGRISYLAERIILEKPKYWEYTLTTEVLRYEMTPVIRRWTALRRGLYMNSSRHIDRSDTILWMQNRIAEIQRIVHAFCELLSTEFQRAWGPPGVPGDDIEIVSVCRLFVEMCKSALEWEEAIRFVVMDEIFRDLQKLFEGIAGDLIDEAAKVPLFLTEKICNNPEPGEHHLRLILTLPPGWNEAVEAALARASERMIRDNQL